MGRLGHKGKRTFWKKVPMSTKLEGGGGGGGGEGLELGGKLFFVASLNGCESEIVRKPDPQHCLQPPLRYSKYNYIRINSIYIYFRNALEST